MKIKDKKTLNNSNENTKKAEKVLIQAKAENVENEEKSSAISFKEQRRILKLIDDERYKSFFLFCCCTGVRVCEAFSIKVKDIDKKNKVIKITLQDTKTKKHRRKVPFLPELLETFDVKKGKLLFEDITDDGSRQYFYKLYKEQNLDLSRHSTRHTFVSVCSHLKIPPQQIQAWVGHTNLKMTTDTYTHKLDNGTSPVYKYIKKLKASLK